MIQIKPIHDKENDCVDDLYATLCNWQGVGESYELIFCQSLSFSFNLNDKSETIGRRLNADPNRMGLLEKFYGIHINNYNDLTWTEKLDLVRRELTIDYPVIISFDSFWTPWDTGSFQKIHFFGHPLLIVGLNERRKEVVCMDPFYNINGTSLSYDILEKGCLQCGTLSIEKRKEITLEELVKYFGEVFPKRFTYEQMRVFSAAMLSMDLIVENENSTDPAKNPILSMITRISKGRNDFGRMLDYLAKRYSSDRILFYSKKFKDIINHWSIVRALLYKMYILNMNATDSSQIIRKVSNRIETLSYLEEEWVNSFLSDMVRGITNVDINVSDYKSIHVYDNHSYIYINIVGLFNNKAFENEECTANFDHLGYYFLKNGLPNEKKWNVNSSPFNVPEIYSSNFDNISCLGQKITIETGYYSSISLLGCSEFGSYSDTIIVKFEDGGSEELEIGFTYWVNELPKYGESVAWEGTFSSKDAKIYEHARIFSCRIPIINHKRIEGIVLPLMPNIHIFAITMQKKAEICYVM